MSRIVLLPLLLLLAAAPAVAQDAASAPEHRFSLIESGPGLMLHREMFLLPATWSDRYNGQQTEAVFQISTKHRLFESRFYAAYTQLSFWQAYDLPNSAPFRETNYNPEFFYRFRPRPWSGGHLHADLGIEHESNGQPLPESRSWNQVFLRASYQKKNWLLVLRLRTRIRERGKDSPDDGIGDDNPDITDHLGYTDLEFHWRPGRGHGLRLRLRGNPDTGYGGLALTWSIPAPRGDRSFYVVRVTQGHGESLIDHQRDLFRVGVGVLFCR